jgi:hypothetical protein
MEEGREPPAAMGEWRYLAHDGQPSPEVSGPTALSR